MPFAIQDDDIDPLLPQPVSILTDTLQSGVLTYRRMQGHLIWQQWYLMVE